MKNENTANGGMSTLATSFLVLAIFSGIVGFIGLNSAMADGLGKAFFGVFMCFFFIALFFGRSK